MHWLDRVAVGFVRSPWYGPFFEGGWGDQDELDEVLSTLEVSPTIEGIELRWQREQEHTDGLVHRDATFDSPSELLPDEMRRGHLRLVTPERDPHRVCLLMAATNDHGYGTRMRLARRLAGVGIASLMLENPYYGARRVRNGPQTVRDALIMGRAAVEEGIALVSALHRVDETTVGVSGYSMGGSIASMVSSLADVPVATAALAPSHSPGPVFCEGILSAAVDWTALGGRTAKHELARALGAASTLRFPAPAHAARAIFAIGRDDGYIPKHAVTALQEHWQGSELRWLRGGHVSLYLFGFDRLARVIVDSFERLGV